jgi:hypothetical protein
MIIQKTKISSVVLVRNQIIPAERPSLVGKVRANFCGERMSLGQRNGYPLPYSRISRMNEYTIIGFFLSKADCALSVFS